MRQNSGPNFRREARVASYATDIPREKKTRREKFFLTLKSISQIDSKIPNERKRKKYPPKKMLLIDADTSLNKFVDYKPKLFKKLEN